jgi:hypothetical protein
MDPITTNNIKAIQQRVYFKTNLNTPFYATGQCVESVLTDMDHFPYKRYYRGIFTSDTPVIFEREAGFRPRQDKCYVQLAIPEKSVPNYCWQYPCSSVKPCKVDKDEDKEKSKKECLNNYVIAP